jgi:hypothetical protein
MAMGQSIQAMPDLTDASNTRLLAFAALAWLAIKHSSLAYSVQEVPTQEWCYLSHSTLHKGILGGR